MMGFCAKHPERETDFYCMKDNIYMCEECLHCPNPRIYCKFRSACPIWFMAKEKESWSREEKEPETPETYTVIFQPDQVEVELEKGSTLLDAAKAADVRLNASCNGKGVCGKCKLAVVSGEVKASSSPLLSEQEKEKNYILACQAEVTGNVTVRIPEETLEKKLKVAGMGMAVTEKLNGLVTEIRPMLAQVPLKMPPPSLEDSTSDVDRLGLALKRAGFDTGNMTVGLEVIRGMAAAMRDGQWDVTASVIRDDCLLEVRDVKAGGQTTQPLGVVVDIGTTSVVVYLVDLVSGSVLAATSGHNKQSACGDDVINRIACSEKDGVKKLNRMVLSTINGLITEVLDSTRTTPEQIGNIVLSGNTIMTHLFMQIDPRYIRREPYIPTASAYPILKAGELGLSAHPHAAVFVMPSPASYVGGDIVSGLLYSGLHREDFLTLFIDVGTNGEIVLGNKDWLMTASCSAGPAFEGGGVRWGMRAEEGAIEKVNIDPSSLDTSYTVVGHVPPRGICGSGMIDLLSEMFLKKIIDAGGKLIVDTSHPRITKDKYGSAFVVAFAHETTVGEDIVFTEADIDNILRSKGAVYAGFNVLLKEAGLDFSMVDRLWIAGGFGQYLDIDKAVNIGLLPDIDRRKFKYLGNSSIAGGYLALLSEEAREEARQISKSMTYLDFSRNDLFMSEYTSALFLPHTNLDAFPRVKEQLPSEDSNNGVK